MIDKDATDLTEAFADTRNAEPCCDPMSMAEFDPEKYRPYLEGIAFTDAQANEFLGILWDMMRMFVEIDVPVDNCGQIVESISNPTTGESKELD